jgi:hypothetical protein
LAAPAAGQTGGWTTQKGKCLPAGCAGHSLVGTGSVSGLASGFDGEIHMRVKAVIDVVCTRDGSTTPGASGLTVELVAKKVFTAGEVYGRKGKVDFQVASPSDQIGVPLGGPATDYGCPSNEWTATIAQYHFLSATMRLFQYDAAHVLQEVCCGLTYLF